MVVDVEVVMVADIVADMVAEMYPTCVSSKLCKFILEETDSISSSAQTFLLTLDIPLYMSLSLSLSISDPLEETDPPSPPHKCFP